MLTNLLSRWNRKGMQMAKSHRGVIIDGSIFDIYILADLAVRPLCNILFLRRTMSETEDDSN